MSKCNVLLTQMRPYFSGFARRQLNVGLLKTHPTLGARLITSKFQKHSNGSLPFMNECASPSAWAGITLQRFTPQRSFATAATPPSNDDEGEKHEHDASKPSAEHVESTPEMWLEALESTAYAPWMALQNTSSDTSSPDTKMKRAYSRTIQIFAYLGRPQEEQVALQFLHDFEKSSSEPGTEMARARKAITILTRSLVRDLAAVPLNSPLRPNHKELFDIHSALLPLHDNYIADGEAPEQPAWSEFWSRAQPILLALGVKLDEDGFGFKPGE